MKNEMENQNLEMISAGWANIQKGNYDSAIQLLLKARENAGSLSKDSLQELSRGLGWAYYHKKEYEEAVECFNTINKKNLSSAPIILQDVFRGLGWSYYQKRDFNEAIDNFNLALKYIDPANVEVMKEARRGLDFASQMKKDKGIYDNSFYEAKSLYISTETPFTELGLPEIIEIEPTSMCNLRCIQCHTTYQKTSNITIDPEFVKHMQGLKGKWVVFGSNYEPLMHPDFCDIALAFSDMGMKTDLITNGTLFNKIISNRLANCDFANIIISFDGIRKETYESIRKNANYEKAIENILDFKDCFKDNKKIYFAINNTLMRRNVDEIVESVDFWEKHGFDHMGFIMMVIRNLNETLKQESLENSRDYVHEKLKQAAQKVIDNNYRITLSGAGFNDFPELKTIYPSNIFGGCLKSNNPGARIPFNPREFIQNGAYPGMPVKCRSPFKFARILFDGNVDLCYQFRIGNIYENSFLDIWYGKKAENVRRQLMANPKICHLCDYYRLCIKAGELNYDDEDNFYSELVHNKGRYPTIVEEFEVRGHRYNIVAWLGDYYALPKELGDINILADNAREMDGVFVDNNLDNLKETLKNVFATQMQLDPENRYVLKDSGWSYFHAGNYDAAIKDLLKALQYIDSTEKSYLQEVFRGLGWSYFKKRNYKIAIEYFSKVLKDGLSDAPIVLQDIYRGFAWSYYYLCDYDSAVRDFSKALQYIGTKEKFHLQEVFRGLGWAYYKSRNFNEAMDNFNLALKYIDSENQKVVKDTRRGLDLASRMKEGEAAHDSFTKTKRPTQAVILAGGKGVRLKPLTDTRPKPMINFNGKPFLEYLICHLKEQGFEKILLLLGYLPDVIQDYFGDGRRWGIRIEYSISDLENETGRRIKLAQEKIEPYFLLMYCDNYWPMNMEVMWKLFFNTGASAQITVYTNKDNYTKNNVSVDCEGMVVCYDKSRSACGLNGVDIGFVILKKEVLDMLPDENVNFEKAVFPVLVQERELSAYLTDHRYYSVGSHEKLYMTELFLKKTPGIILDRDGVLNEKAPKAEYVKSWRDFKWLPGAKEAIVLLKRAGWAIIIVTNQAGIARGMMTKPDLESIHQQMKEELAKEGAAIDALYYCPHGWDEGCECRKPKPGMLFQAQRDFHLDLSRTFFIGDDVRDKEAGDTAGCKVLLVDAQWPLLRLVKEKILIGENDFES